ncbi:MAG: Glyceraldehyde dehydrogenase medium chain [Candidatus Heimdallarchaeota archaeon LC_3]|nr:MAG: Glyceraldehyde dehydrogenase medium chain [Candidatus Heimdallarchaeota archaeon LC_3]
MLENLNNYFYPTSLKEALKNLKEPNSRPIAGGTALTLIKDSSTQALVDLSGLNLSYINDTKKEFQIGALTSSYEIAFHALLPQSLKDCARKIGDVPLIHAVTIGGNISDIYPWSDYPCVLLALGASITVYNIETGKPENFTADEYFEKFRKTKPGLVTEIKIPKSVKNSSDYYQKYTYTIVEKSQANLATYFEWNDQKEITKATVVVSAVTKFPQRVKSVEKMITGQKITPDLVEKYQKEISSSIEAIPNFKTSREYRKEIIGVYLKRALEKCQQEVQ